MIVRDSLPRTQGLRLARAGHTANNSSRQAGALEKMDRVTIAAESSFDSDYCWDIDEQVGRVAKLNIYA